MQHYGGLTVLTYHRISEHQDHRDPLKVSAETFEKQLIYLKECSRLLSGEELDELLRNNKSFPENAILITFDDGWRDNYENAYPILKKQKVPALIFLSTDYIGTNRIFWHERFKQVINNLFQDNTMKNLGDNLPKLPDDTSIRLEKIIESTGKKRARLVNDYVVHMKKYSPDRINQLIDELEQISGKKILETPPTMLSWEEVREMAEGNVTFGSHTESHALLTRITESEILSELTASKRIIEEKLGRSACFVSYPNGFYNSQVINAARDAGYSAGFTCLPGKNHDGANPFELRRKHISEYSTSGFNDQFSKLFFKIELSGIRDRIKSWRAIGDY